jgi:AcrR family transcriptional regulator
MATAAESFPQPRSPLNRQRVLEAAVRLADAGGLEALSMRKLGQEVGVEAMSLYNHVANKEDVHAGMVELVLDEFELPSDELDWKAGIRAAAMSAHDSLVRHRWASGLMMTVQTVSDARLRWNEWVLRTLREAGFSANLTHHAYHALESHIVGFALWRTSMPFETHAELVGLAERFLAQFPVDDYPYFVEHVREHLDPPAQDEPTEFEFGLDLILDGLERLRDRG